MPSYDTINIWVKSIFQPELLQSSDFQHRTTKLDILHQPTIKTVQITLLKLKPPGFDPRHPSHMEPVATSAFLLLPSPLPFSHRQVVHLRNALTTPPRASPLPGSATC